MPIAAHLPTGEAVTGTQRTLITLALVAAGLFVSLLAPSLFEPQPFAVFLVTTLVAAWLGGWEPGAAAGILGVLAGIVVTRAARGSWVLEPAAGLWLALNLLAALLVGSLRRALMRLQQDLKRQTAPRATPDRDAAARLEASTKHLRRVLDTLPTLVGVLTPEGVMLEANRAALEIAALNPADVLGAPFTSAYWWSYSAEVQAQLRDAIAQAAQGHTTRRDMQIRIADDTLITIDFTLAPMFDDEGRVTHLVPSALDITDRRREALERERLIAQIAQERDRLRTLIDSITDEIWFCDAQGNIELVNAAVRQEFGLDAGQESTLGTLKAFIAPMGLYDADGRPRPPEDAPLLRSLRGETIRNEVEIVRHPGDPDPVYRRVSAAPLTNSTGSIVGAVAVVHNITEQIETEAEIRALNAELEQRVRDRTAQLRAVNRELEAFSYSVSHDLRTPLRAIDGFSHALLEDYGDILDQEGRYHLERIRAASQRLGQIIDDLLKLSRLVRSDIQRGPTNLSEIAASTLNDLREATPDRSVRITVQPGVVAEGDARLLRVALDNLLGNAWKFTGKTPDAQIEFGTLDYEDERVYYVRDNGAGFDMAYADKLFGAFQRLHSAAEFEGTGIGLATVQRIIHRHGGRIWAQSAVNEGATFYFTLPSKRGGDHGRGTSENHPVG